MSALPTRDAYRLWSETYDDENPLTTLDAIAVRLLTGELHGLDLLDAACGTGRRLVFGADAPRSAVGVDLVYEMLAKGRRDPARPTATAGGDVRALPLSAARFDVAWCRLAAGHLSALDALYRELGRVLRPGGSAVVTDFHPEAIRRGHARVFRDASGVPHVVEHVVHEAGAHERAAAGAGFTFDAGGSFGIGCESRGFYERAGKLERYARDEGMPLLLALKFRRCA
jgi:SAM-dependent methyltransferase